MRLVRVVLGFHDLDEPSDDGAPFGGLLTDEAGDVRDFGFQDQVGVGLSEVGCQLLGGGGFALGGGSPTSSLAVASDELGGLVGAEVGEYLGGFELVVRLEAWNLAVHSPGEEPDDLASVVGLLSDDGPEAGDAGVFYVVVWAVRRFGQFCCL